ncbi:MAG: hypothetical protein AAFR00_05880 [Pseudomonadota bacterium]
MTVEGLLSLMLVFVVAELVMIPVFFLIRREVEEARNPRLLSLETVKGWLERAALALGLWAGFPQILTAFAGFKLVSIVLKREDHDLARNYFIIGNILSTLLAMGYVVAVALIQPGEIFGLFSGFTHPQ